MLSGDEEGHIEGGDGWYAHRTVSWRAPATHVAFVAYSSPFVRTSLPTHRPITLSSSHQHRRLNLHDTKHRDHDREPIACESRRSARRRRTLVVLPTSSALTRSLAPSLLLGGLCVSDLACGAERSCEVLRMLSSRLPHHRTTTCPSLSSQVVPLPRRIICRESVSYAAVEGEDEFHLVCSPNNAQLIPLFQTNIFHYIPSNRSRSKIADMSPL